MTINAGVTANDRHRRQHHVHRGGERDHSAGLTKVGNGTLTLTTASTYAGTTLISGGKLKLGATPGTRRRRRRSYQRGGESGRNCDHGQFANGDLHDEPRQRGPESSRTRRSHGNIGPAAAPGYSANAINGHARVGVQRERHAGNHRRVCQQRERDQRIHRRIPAHRARDELPWRSELCGERYRRMITGRRGTWRWMMV